MEPRYIERPIAGSEFEVAWFSPASRTWYAVCSTDVSRGCSYPPFRNERQVTKMKSNENSVVAVFESHEQAENAIRELQKDGFDMKKLSIVGKDYHTEEHVVGYYTVGDRMAYWGKLGAFWGGFWGLLFGSAFFWVPGIGKLLVAGPLVMWIVGALEGAVVTGGLTALGAGLYSIGIPKNSILQYEAEVKNGQLLLVAHGSADEVERARELLDQTHAKMTTVHGEPAAVGA